MGSDIVSIHTDRMSAVLKEAPENTVKVLLPLTIK